MSHSISEEEKKNTRVGFELTRVRAKYLLSLIFNPINPYATAINYY